MRFDLDHDERRVLASALRRYWHGEYLDDEDEDDVIADALIERLDV